MIKEVLMPKLSSTMTHGHVTQWFKSEGDLVKVGEPVFEVMTDKIAIEVESYDDGTLLKTYVEVGEVVPVNTIIAYIGDKGDEVPDSVNKGEQNSEETVEEKTQVEIKQESTFESYNSGKVRATPAARKLANEKGLDIQQLYLEIQPKKRLHKKDIDNYIPKVQTTKIQAEDKVIPWTGIRKAVADQMHKSVMTAPQVTLNANVNVDKLIELRSKLNKKLDIKVSYTSLIAAYVVKVLKKHPRLNAHALEDGIHVKSSINMGIANAVDDGLIVPVIAHANDLNIVELTEAMNELIDKAKTNSLLPDEIVGGTFTISSLGSTRVRDFSPILNVPEVAILGVGTFEKVVVVDHENQFKATNQMTLSLTFDHRAIDGYPAALFLTDLTELIENPEYSLMY